MNFPVLPPLPFKVVGPEGNGLAKFDGSLLLTRLATPFTAVGEFRALVLALKLASVHGSSSSSSVSKKLSPHGGGTNESSGTQSRELLAAKFDRFPSTTGDTEYILGPGTFSVDTLGVEGHT